MFGVGYGESPKRAGRHPSDRRRLASARTDTAREMSVPAAYWTALRVRCPSLDPCKRPHRLGAEFPRTPLSLPGFANPEHGRARMGQTKALAGLRANCPAQVGWRPGASSNVPLIWDFGLGAGELGASVSSFSGSYSDSATIGRSRIACGNSSISAADPDVAPANHRALVSYCVFISSGAPKGNIGVQTLADHAEVIEVFPPRPAAVTMVTGEPCPNSSPTCASLAGSRSRRCGGTP
jgi:hypothetical protein